MDFTQINDYRLNLFLIPTDDSVKFPNCSNYLSDLIDKSWNINPLDTFKIIMNWRDCRGGRCNYNNALSALLYIEYKYPNWFIENIYIIPEYGSWLDLIKLWHFVSYKSKVTIMTHIVNTLKNENILDNHNILLSKWIPNENSKWDRITKPRFLIELCKNMFNIQKVTSNDIKNLRKNIINPLRNKLNIIETNICQHKNIEYDKLSLFTINKYKKIFIKKDSKNFNKFLENNNEINTKLAVKNDLLPHELVKYYLDGNKENKQIELQWKTLKQKYNFKNCIPVCDISGSMYGRPMEISIALSLLFLYDNKLITFNETPEIYFIPECSLYNQIQYIKNIMWGSYTNFEEIINLTMSLSESIKTIFIFSDMDFDKAMGYNVNLSIVKQKYNLLNLNIPKVLFWNLSGTIKTVPIEYPESIIKLSGYSESLLYSILHDNISLFNIIIRIINSTRYNRIIVPSNS